MSGPRPLPKPHVIALSALFLGALFYAQWRRGGEPAETAVATRDAVKLSGKTMGTTWHATAVGASDPEAAHAAVQAALDRVNDAMSTYKDDSELMRLNRAPVGEPFALSDGLWAVLTLAAQVSDASGGAFDVTVAPLVDAWGFGPADVQGAPDEAALAEARAAVGWEGLALDAGTATRTRAGLRVDLSAVAKGYGVDQALSALQAMGVADAMVEVGGEVAVVGNSPAGEPWRVGVERPDGSGGVEEAVPMTSGAMATSGDYRNYRVVDGVRVSHTIDPRTGAPIAHGLASVSVLAPTCAEADAWATALNVLGPEEGPALAEARGMAALFLVHTGDAFEVRATTAWGAAVP